jgi:hypothetical protein
MSVLENPMAIVPICEANRPSAATRCQGRTALFTIQAVASPLRALQHAGVNARRRVPRGGRRRVRWRFVPYWPRSHRNNDRAALTAASGRYGVSTRLA